MKSEALKILITAVLSALIAYLGVHWQFSRDIKKMRMELTYQGQLEALKIKRERIIRKNRIEELAERIKKLSEHFREDSTHVCDSINQVYDSRIKALKIYEARESDAPIVSGITTQRMIQRDALNVERKRDTEKWISLRKRLDESTYLEFDFLKRLDIADTLAIPTPPL